MSRRALTLALAAISLAIPSVVAAATPRVTHPRSGTAAKLTCGVEGERRGLLTVTVRDATSSAVPGAKVNVVDPRESTIANKGVTGNDGRLEIRDIAGKPAYLVVSLDGFHTTGAEVAVAAHCEASVEVVLEVGGTICDVEVDAQKP